MTLIKDIISTTYNSAANGLIIAIFLTAVITYIKEHSLSKYINKLNHRQNRIVLYFIAYIYMIFYKTVFSRPNSYKPFSKVWGGWKIPIYEYTGISHESLIGNTLLFIIFSILLILSFGHLFKNNKSILLYCTGFSFILSIFIELCQIVLKRGTFQISDLVYNTLGGLIGAGIYILIQKKRRK